jgi:CoA:oxalate CoA-transferase
VKPRPLAGVRVLDLTRVVAGPFAGRMLSDLGADVVKLEPPEGDVTRIWGHLRHGISGFYQQQNAGKRNICIDLRQPAGVELAVDLAAASHIVIENFRAHVIDRLGLSYDVLSARNPALVLCSISGFGRNGPESGRPAYAPVIEAEAGFVHRQSVFDDTDPSDPAISTADYTAGLHALVGMLAALRHAERTGQGTHLDLSMVDAMVATDDYIHHAIDQTPPERLGGIYFKVANGDWLLVASQWKPMWAMLAAHYGFPDPTPPGADLAGKIEARRAFLEQWVTGFGSAAEAHAALAEANVASAQLRSAEEALNGPTGRHRGVVAQVDDRGGSARGVIQSPYRFSSLDSGVRGGAPRRGEHNEDVLTEWLGTTGDTVEALRAAGVLLAEQ